MEKKKIKSLVAMALLMAVGISCSFVAGTYAKYTSKIEGNKGTAMIAKWAFDEDNESTDLTINFAQTYDPNTLVANRIAPGTEGSFEIELSNENSEVMVEYTIGFSGVDGIPTNLKFYTDSSHVNKITDFSNTADMEDLTGTIAIGGTEEIKIYWVWEYETTNGDAADTANGKAGGEDGDKLEFTMNITGVQVEPFATTN